MMMRAARIAPASRLPRMSMAVSVTIFARPSFTPGIGTGAGSCASSMKMVSAIAVSTAMSASFFVLGIYPAPSMRTLR